MLLFFLIKKMYTSIITELGRDVKSRVKEFLRNVKVYGTRCENGVDMKHRGYYLQKVFFILTSAENFLPFGESVIGLQKAGISVEVFLAEELPDRREQEELPEQKNCEWQREESQALYVTDHGDVARRLLEEGLAVLGYQHSQNATEGFAGVKYILESPESTPAEYFERVFRRYAGLPWSILETERCYVRESCEEDVEAFYEIYKAPEVTRYTEGLFEHAVSERAYIREYIEKVYAYFEFGVWTVILKESGEIIGRAGISVREGFDILELGYVFGLPWQGKGLAKEVCEGIWQYAKEELEMTELQVLIQEENDASIRLAQKLGFCRQDDMIIAEKQYIRMVRRG